jgi:hypothetical protein
MNFSDGTNYTKIRLTFNLLFSALLVAQLIYLLAGLLIIKSNNFEGMTNLNTIFMFIVPVINASVILAAKFIYGKSLLNLDSTQSLNYKLKLYQTNNIIKLALLEGANIINISAMIITGNYFFGAFFVIVFILFFLNKPTVEKFVMEYQLKPDDAVKILG